MGCSPCLIPPLVTGMIPDTLEESAALEVLKCLEFDVLEAQDNLLAAKMDQAHHANKSWLPEHEYKIRDQVK
jgi:hypothetical protein